MGHNTDKEVRDKCLQVLARGGLLLYPTDTVWGIGCDATNRDAVEKVFALKKRPDSKALICLVSDQAMLERHVTEVPALAYDLMDLSTKPTTIVYDAPRGVAANLVAARQYTRYPRRPGSFLYPVDKPFQKAPGFHFCQPLRRPQPEVLFRNRIRRF